MNKDVIFGLVVMIFLTTLMWSLNLNFLLINTTWLEIFGVIVFIALIWASIASNKSDE